MTFDEYRHDVFRTTVGLINGGAFDELAGHTLAMEDIWADERVTAMHDGRQIQSQLDAAICVVGAVGDPLFQEHLAQLEIELSQYESDLIELDKLIRSLAFQLEWNEIEEMWLRRVSMLASLNAVEPVYFFDQIPVAALGTPNPTASDRRQLLFDSSGLPFGNLKSFV